jgi:xylose isomerase
MAIDYRHLFGMDVNDNSRSWDDDLVANNLHPIEVLEFSLALHPNKWNSVVD